MVNGYVPESELDELVAEKVMGLAPCDNWKEVGSADGPVMVRECHLPHHCYPRHHALAFPTLIAAARHIVEHLAEKGWETTIRKVTGDDTFYEVQIDRHTGNPADNVTAEAGTAPVAICTAALQASGYNGALP